MSPEFFFDGDDVIELEVSQPGEWGGARVADAHQQPRKDWLDFVVSSKARSNIRHAIRVVERSRAQQLGEDILNRELRRAGISLRSVREGGELAAAARAEIRDGTVDDLFAAISYGKIPASNAVRRLRGSEGRAYYVVDDR